MKRIFKLLFYLFFKKVEEESTFLPFDEPVAKYNE